MDNQKEIHTVAPKESHSHTIILLHGRDSNAVEFAEEFFESQASDDRTLPEIFPTVKWVFPTSDLRSSARFKTEMSQWFDIWSVEAPLEGKEIQTNGLRESISQVLDIIHAEMTLILSDRIILGGISQGCATAILALLCSGVRLGGFMGFCSWLPFQDDIERIAKRSQMNAKVIEDVRNLFGVPVNESKATSLSNSSGSYSNLVFKTPIFLSHSKDDDVVPINNGEKLCNGLKELGLSVTWRPYEDGGHWINEPQGVDDIVSFLRDRTVNC